MLYKNSVSPYLQHRFSIPYQNKKIAYSYSECATEGQDVFIKKRVPMIGRKNRLSGGGKQITTWLPPICFGFFIDYHRLGEYRR
jgi:hypothetical protein